MDPAVASWADRAQSGFINDRSLLENVVGVDAAALSTAALERARVALLLYDIAAAFPSLSRRYLWAVLIMIGIPRFLIRAFQALYRRNRHWLALGGFFRFAFRLQSPRAIDRAALFVGVPELASGIALGECDPPHR